MAGTRPIIRGLSLSCASLQQPYVYAHRGSAPGIAQFQGISDPIPAAGGTMAGSQPCSRRGRAGITDDKENSL